MVIGAPGNDSCGDRQLNNLPILSPANWWVSLAAYPLVNGEVREWCEHCWAGSMSRQYDGRDSVISRTVPAKTRNCSIGILRTPR